MAYLTLSVEGSPDDAQRDAIDEIIRRQGGLAVWRSSAPAGRSYALLDVPDEYDAALIRATSGGTVYETAVIALAVFPTVTEALPYLVVALGGPGRPAGVLACRPCAGGLVVEWDPNLSCPELIVGLVNVELRRFGGGRTMELLSPLPVSTIAKIAAQGLETPEITPKRVLELLIDRD